MCNIARSELVKVPFSKSGVLNSCVLLVQQKDEEVVRQATGCLANIAENPDTHARLLSEQGLHYIVNLMRSRRLSVHREACRAAANILATEDLHIPYMSEGGLKSMFR